MAVCENENFSVDRNYSKSVDCSVLRVAVEFQSNSQYERRTLPKALRSFSAGSSAAILLATTTACTVPTGVSADPASRPRNDYHDRSTNDSTARPTSFSANYCSSTVRLGVATNDLSILRCISPDESRPSFDSEDSLDSRSDLLSDTLFLLLLSRSHSIL